MRENELKLIIRSHEGPDARESRPEMPHMLEGYAEDHVNQLGKLMTIFSAPDYPQFIPDHMARYENKACVAILRAPDYSKPIIEQFEATLPRPAASPYYDLDEPDSDEEFENLLPTASGMTDVEHEADECDEVEQTKLV